MKCKIYLPQDWMYGDATAFYVDIIAEAMSTKYESVEKIRDINDIEENDVVVTVISQDVIHVKKRNPHKIINWYQGISPEEFLMFSKQSFNIFKKLYIYLKISMHDFYALWVCDYNIFVSNRMRKFYKHKFGYCKSNYFIMPCFNQMLNTAAFNDKKYSVPAFVYAGSLDGWQCFEKTVNTFKEIKTHINNATFTVLTASQDEAKDILAKYDVEATVKYVNRKSIDEELSKYKYGFIIRENNPVNNVATPTKMNSYLANGIIPVFTDVVGSFKENLSGLTFSVPLTTSNAGLEKLYNLETKRIKAVEVLEEYGHLFDTYYGRDYYLEKLRSTAGL